jgi:xylose isomerase
MAIIAFSERWNIRYSPTEAYVSAICATRVKTAINVSDESLEDLDRVMWGDREN